MHLNASKKTRRRKHLCIWFIRLLSQHLVSFNRKLRVNGNQFSSLRIHRQQWDDPRQRDHGIFRRRVAVYQRSYRRRCTSRTSEDREWPLPCRLHHANVCTDRWPFDLRIEIHVLQVERIHLRAKRRRHLRESGFHCFHPCKEILNVSYTKLNFNEFETSLYIRTLYWSMLHLFAVFLVHMIT